MSLREQLSAALDQADAKRYAALDRRSRTSLGLLQATVLRAAITRGRRFLEAGADSETRTAAARSIEWAIDDIVTAIDEARGGA